MVLEEVASKVQAAAVAINQDQSSLIRLANAQLSPRIALRLLRCFSAQLPFLFTAPNEAFLQVEGLSLRHLEKLRDPSNVPTREQLRWCEAPGSRIITAEDSEYPAGLNDLVDPPAMLFINGNLEERDRFAVAIVGSRHATPYGKAVAEQFATGLSRAGLTVVSGGARGIDTAVHRSTVHSGGRAVAILGCGPDVAYPPENASLFQEIASQGAVISEYPPGAQPDAWHFPARNRIISGLSQVTVVVEASDSSGALITARTAIEQGRAVLAVPGNIDRPASEGCNALIREGISPALGGEDILQAMGAGNLSAAPSQGVFNLDIDSGTDSVIITPKDVTPVQEALLRQLDLSPRHVDSIASSCSIPIATVSVELTMLEMKGLAKRLPGNHFVRAGLDRR